MKKELNKLQNQIKFECRKYDPALYLKEEINQDKSKHKFEYMKESPEHLQKKLSEY